MSGIVRPSCKHLVCFMPKDVLWSYVRVLTYLVVFYLSPSPPSENRSQRSTITKRNGGAQSNDIEALVLPSVGTLVPLKYPP